MRAPFLSRATSTLAVLFLFSLPAWSTTMVQLDFEVPYLVLDPPIGPVVDPVSFKLTVPEAPTPIPTPQNVFFDSTGDFWLHAAGKFLFFGPTSEGYTFDNYIDTEYIRAYDLFTSTVPYFSGPLTAPVFLPGVYRLDYDAPVFGPNIDYGTLTISVVGGSATPAPELGSFLLLATGGCVLAAALRQRVSRFAD